MAAAAYRKRLDVGYFFNPLDQGCSHEGSSGRRGRSTCAPTPALIERQQAICDRVDPVPEPWRAFNPLPTLPAVGGLSLSPSVSPARMHSSFKYPHRSADKDTPWPRDCVGCRTTSPGRKY